MTGVFLSVPRYNWCAPLSHPSSCMLVIHGLSQQSSKEEYKPWKWGATARYYAYHTKIILPTRKSGKDPADSRTTRRPPDHFKETRQKLQWYSHVFRSSGLWKMAEDRADRGRDGKTTSGNGRAWSSPSPRGQWRTEKNGGNWLWNHLWCPNDPSG